MEKTERETLEGKAFDMGNIHGIAAGTWVTDGNTTVETYRWLLAGIEDGDPQVLDTLPSAPLSGEWAGNPTPLSVLEELGVEEDDDLGRWDFLLDAYELGFGQGVADEVSRACRYQLVNEDES